MNRYISQVLGVIVALLEDPEESVQLTAVQCLLKVNSLHLVSCTYFLPYFNFTIVLLINVMDLGSESIYQGSC